MGFVNVVRTKRIPIMNAGSVLLVEDVEIRGYEGRGEHELPDQVVVERIADRFADLFAGQPRYAAAGEPGTYRDDMCSTRLAVQPSFGRNSASWSAVCRQVRGCGCASCNR
jgi:hypothetical protein